MLHIKSIAFSVKDALDGIKFFIDKTFTIYHIRLCKSCFNNEFDITWEQYRDPLVIKKFFQLFIKIILFRKEILKKLENHGDLLFYYVKYLFKKNKKR